MANTAHRILFNAASASASSQPYFVTDTGDIASGRPNASIEVEMPISTKGMATLAIPPTAIIDMKLDGTSHVR
ncbi:MAG TPA: hypothetical protein VK641_15385 [Terriglobales bacterium]|nr:hypothetical protein [Terriglobales bacterium]